MISSIENVRYSLPDFKSELAKDVVLQHGLKRLMVT